MAGQAWRDFRLAASFLTRLTPPMGAAAPEFPACLAWFPAVGLLLGVVLIAPFRLGLLEGHTWVQAWLVVLGSMWATRGLHLDGLADLGDAWGSGASGERFWEIVKDSRVGAFGVMALVLAVTGQMALFGRVLDLGLWGLAAWSFVLGRAGAVLLAWLGRDLSRPGLAALFLAGATGRRVLASSAAAVIAGLVLAGAEATVAGCLLAGLIVLGLRSLGKRQGGVNGDFLGAAIVLGEMAACLAGLF
jgi:adenosylcobinamide-GDP ribazoletransferase